MRSESLKHCVVALALCAVSVASDDDDEEDCSGDVECVVVVGVRETCEGRCVGGIDLGFDHQEELQKHMREQARTGAHEVVEESWDAFQEEMFVQGIKFCVADAAKVRAEISDATSIVIEDLPSGHIGQARKQGDRYVTVIDMDEARDWARSKGAPLHQAVSYTVLHEFIHHEQQEWGEDKVYPEAERRYVAAFGIPSLVSAAYDAAVHADAPTCGG